MSPAEQLELRLKVAIACGWTRRPATLPGNVHCWNKPGVTCPEMAMESEIPHYESDLNAMHEAEKLLTEDRLWFMSARLADIVPAETPIAHANAEARAKAFLESCDKFLGEDDE